MKPVQIVHLFPDLLNLYGDKGNLAALKKRLLWRGIEARVTLVNVMEELDLETCDILFLGGGSDREQELVCSYLLPHREALLSYIEKGGVMLAFCGGFSMVGETYISQGKAVPGLNLLPIRTTPVPNRMIGDVILQSDISSAPICGFENHPGAMDIGEFAPLGTVLFGHGNNGQGQKEGLIYKNLIGTHLHGPLLPKNPQLCDNILSRALENKGQTDALIPLEDDLEAEFGQYITDMYLKNQG